MNTQSDDDSVEFEVDASNFVPRPAEGIVLQKAQEYRENLKKYAPEEYAKMMQQREEYFKERETLKKQTP